MGQPKTHSQPTPVSMAVRALIFGLLLLAIAGLGLLLLPAPPDSRAQESAQTASQSRGKADAPAAAPARSGRASTAYDRGLLWRIEGKGAAASFLFGTIHIDDPRVTALPDPVRKSLDAATSFTMEVTFEPSNLLQLAGRMVYLDGRDLPGVVGDELFARLAAESPSLGIPAEMLRLFRPWAMALLLLMPQQNPAEILDNVLFGIASAQKKPVHQLETVDEQISAFENLSEPDQVLLLRHTMDNRARTQQQMGKLIDAYLARDLAAMARISEDTTGATDEVKRLNDTFRKRVLDERNTRMVERMQPQLQQGGAFVAVGALHLHGANGLLALLEARGYRVTRVY